MGYSNWKKLFYILSIISIIISIFSRVFANAPYYFTYQPLTKDELTVSLGSSSYGGVANVKLAPFLYDFKNILIFYHIDSGNTNYKSLLIMWSDSDFSIDNNKLYAKTAGKFYGCANIYDLSKYSLSDFTPTKRNEGEFMNGGYVSNIEGYSNYNYCALLGSLYDYKTGELIVQNFPTLSPSFTNPKSEIQSLNFDQLFINPHDFGVDNNLYLKVLEVTNKVEQENEHDNVYYFNDTTFTLNKSSKYLQEFFDSGTYYYSIPYSALKFKRDTSYYLLLTNDKKQITNYIGEIHTDDNIFDVVLIDTADIVTTDQEILDNLINNNPSDNTGDIINNNLPRPSNPNVPTIPGMNIDIPEDNTINDFNWIYNFLKSNISAEPSIINFHVPFVNYDISINPDLLLNLLGQDSYVIVLIHTFYYFIISYYIIQSIRKYIEKINNGDVLTHTDTNIKADML